MYLVYSLTEQLPKYVDCIIQPQGAAVPAIYTRAFGPASEDECKTWVSQNCVSSDK